MADIGLDGEAAPAQRLYICFCFTGCTCVAAIIDNNVGSCLGQALSCCATNALAAPSDQGNFACQGKLLLTCHMCYPLGRKNFFALWFCSIAKLAFKNLAFYDEVLAL